MISKILLYIIQFVLAILLIPISNWIASRSLTFGYETTSGFSERWQTPAFNWVYRVVTPTIYIILLAAIIKAFRINELTKDIYIVTVIYVFLRMLLYFLLGKARLVNWTREIFLASFTIGLSYFVYINLIISSKTLLPEWESFRNELWLLILVFIYGALNEKKNTSITDKRAKERRENYWKIMYFHFEKSYSFLLEVLNKNIHLKSLIYSIIILENFNRPILYRTIERLLVLLGRQTTQGIMQVKSDKIITEKASILIGIKMLKAQWRKSEKKIEEQNRRKKKSERQPRPTILDSITFSVAIQYNHDYTYATDAAECSHFIRTKIWNYSN